ncbi:hypothetical protein Franean1_3087 [Parafrankia sp. EAN1pec]|nr:hypothetical protein Franean1_3087 [Frankia sp. EAN1pec]
MVTRIYRRGLGRRDFGSVGKTRSAARNHRRSVPVGGVLRARPTDLTSLPLHDFTQNQLWCALVVLALDLTIWTQTLALAGQPARRWEPKRLRHRLFSLAGRLARHVRTTVLHLAGPWPGVSGRKHRS